MLFTTLTFLLFLPVTLIVYSIAPQRHRWIILLAASVAFYAYAKLEYLALLAVATLVSYLCALVMARRPDKRSRRPALVIGILVNFGLLVAFKYVDFGISVIEKISGGQLSLPHPELVVPIGISFYTFRVASYAIDVYRGTISAERHFGYYSLYVAFFPLMLSGPLERAPRLLPRLRKLAPATAPMFREGIARILIGFMKKAVLADRIAILIDPMVAEPTAFGTRALLLTSYAYMLQVYFDFSGYSDIAIGVARLFGIDVAENFRRPLLSSSIPEFWRRWHISLMGWFRDYIFVPLGGLRAKGLKLIAVTALVFFISGIWHGAGLNYVLWGLLHAFYMTMAILLAPVMKRANKRLDGTRFAPWWTAICIFVTFHLVSIGQVLFWGGSLDAFWHVLKATTFHFGELPGTGVFTGKWPREVSGYFFHFDLVVALVIGGCFLIAEKVADSAPAAANRIKRFVFDREDAGATGIRWTLAYLAIGCLVFFGKWDAGSFIYFQF